MRSAAEPGPGLRLLSVVTALAVIVATHLVAPGTSGMLPQARADATVSGAFALGGGMGGSVDSRTGQFSVSVPLASVASRGESGIDLTLSWEQARATAGLDRSGWGGGWSMGMTFVETQGAVTVWPANGGSYVADSSYDSGLRYYLLADIVFGTAGGTLPGRPVPGGTAIPDQGYSYTITYTDGKVDYYDGDGNLIARMDRFGNRTDVAYTSPSPDQFQPTSIVDAYGLTTTLGYDAGGSFVVTAPKRSDGVVPVTTIDFDNDGNVGTVTDPNGAITTFGYTDVQVDDGVQHLLNTATGPAGATSTVGYTTVSYPSAPTLVIAQTLDVADAKGNAMTPTRTFDIDPTPGNSQHNYAGYPDYLSTDGTDQLFEQADPNYTYTTMLSTPAAATVSTYDSGHRLITRLVQGAGNDGVYVTSTTQTADYPGLQPAGFQPANYARPTGTTVTHSARSGPNGLVAQSGKGRTVTTTTSYDDHGRIQQSVDELGGTTTYTYDNTFGLVTSTVVTGKDGTTRTTTNTLSDDKKTVKTNTVAIGTTAAKATARNVTTYEFDQYGEPNSRTVTWAKDAAPANNGGGPASTATTYSSVVDAASVTRKLTVTQATGTTAESKTTTTFDLVSGKVVAYADELGRVTTTGYDAGGRVTSVTPPTGLTTTTAYTPASGTNPATKLEKTADGHQLLTSYDGLGRVVKVTDNVKNRAFVTSPTTRTVASHVYSANKVTKGSGAPGITLTSTDMAGRVTTMVTDGLGRTVLETTANGVTKTTAYDDVAHTVTRQVIGYGASQASQVAKVAYDNLNRMVSSRTSYPDGTRTSIVDPARLTEWDGIGRRTSVTEDDVVTTPDYSGAGGVAATVAVAPAKTARNPGAALTATDTTMLDGRPTNRVLQESGQTASSGTTVAYDAAGRVTSATDPLGRVTGYTYYDDGQVHTRTTPSGTVTTNTFDPAGRPDTVTWKDKAGNTGTVTHAYVPAGQPGAGQLASVTDASGTVSYSYDVDGNRTKVSYPDGSSTSNSYGDNGLLATSVDVTGATTTYAYNTTDGSMKSATQTLGKTTLATVGYTYDPLGRLKTTTRGNGLVTTNTYTPHSLLATQTTVDGKNNAVESHSYAYDSHHNLKTKTSTTAQPSRCTAPCASGPTTFGTYTTSYSYDAYDRLVGSSVYSGAKATGTPLTTNGYILDVAGNVTTNTRTTTTTSGSKATTTKQTIVNTVDASGQLTAQTTGSAAAVKQAFNDDGHVTTALNGATTTYRPDGLVATVTQQGVTTTFDYWADGRRKRSTTVDPAGATTATEFHYSPDGTLLNDTTTVSGTGVQAGSATASYLVTGGREARSLQPGTTPAGAVGGKAATPVTSGAGVGYFLRDRHSSVTALVDGTGAVTNTYAYTDYGAPALLDGRPGTVVGAASGTTAGTSNPLRYSGSSLKALYTDTALGTMMTPARFYDPGQGRFMSRDTANVHNRYAGFDANPIMKADPTGLSAIADFWIDLIYIVVFVAATVATAGAASVATGAAFALQLVATVANVVGLASNATRFADDVAAASTGKHFLSDDARSDLSNVATVAGAVAGVAGMFGAGAAAAGEAATKTLPTATTTKLITTATTPEVTTTATQDATTAATTVTNPVDSTLETVPKPATAAETADELPGEGSNDSVGQRSQNTSPDSSSTRTSDIINRSPGSTAAAPEKVEPLTLSKEPTAPKVSSNRLPEISDTSDDLSGKLALEAERAKLNEAKAFLKNVRKAGGATRAQEYFNLTASVIRAYDVGELVL